eukprot:g41621.t1
MSTMMTSYPFVFPELCFHKSKSYILEKFLPHSHSVPCEPAPCFLEYAPQCNINVNTPSVFSLGRIGSHARILTHHRCPPLLVLYWILSVSSQLRESRKFRSYPVLFLPCPEAISFSSYPSTFFKALPSFPSRFPMEVSSSIFIQVLIRFYIYSILIFLHCHLIICSDKAGIKKRRLRRELNTDVIWTKHARSLHHPKIYSHLTFSLKPGRTVALGSGKQVSSEVRQTLSLILCQLNI